METLNVTRSNDYEIVQLDSGKVNAIDAVMGSELFQYFTTAEQNQEIRGVILTGRPHGFCAGINIPKLFAGGPQYSQTFWENYFQALQAMVNFSKPFICAITGYAPAGACMLAVTADYRIMGSGEKHKIGMHEVALSLQIPDMLLRMYSYWIGKKQAIDFVMNSRLFSAEEAVEIGLVNEACAVEEVLPRAESVMQRWLQSHDKILSRTKQLLRADYRELVDMEIAPMVQEILADAQDASLAAKQLEFAKSLKKG